ncbi:MAG: hypothetical protein ACRC5T_03280 [Cetobacterium sp.]
MTDIEAHWFQWPRKYYASPEELPTKEGLYRSGAGQVWELHDDGSWDEVHGDGGEFADHELLPLFTSRDLLSYDSIAAAADQLDRNGFSTSHSEVGLAFVAALQAIQDQE